DLTVNPSRFPNVSISNRCAANPKPLRPCSWVLTLKYPIAACIVLSSLMEGSRYAFYGCLRPSRRLTAEDHSRPVADGRERLLRGEISQLGYTAAVIATSITVGNFFRKRDCRIRVVGTCHELGICSGC